MSSEEQQLREALRRRGESVEASGDFSGPAVALAGRRHRRAVGAAVTAGALAVAGIGVAAWVGAGPRVPAPVPATRTTTTAPPSPSPTSPSPSPTATASPSRSPSATATPTPPPAAPSTPYALGGTVHRGDQAIEAPGGRILAFALLDSGGVVVTTTTGTRVDPDAPGYLLDADGRVLREFGRDWVAARDGSRFAYVAGGQVVVRSATGGLVARRGLDELGADSGDGRGVLLAMSADTVFARATASGGSSTVAWDVGTGRLARVEGTVGAVSPDGSTVATVDGDFCLAVLALRGQGRDRGPGCQRVGAPVTFSDDAAYLLTQFESEGGYWEEHRVVRLRDLAVLDLPGDPQLPGWTGAFEPGTDRLVFSRNSSNPPKANTGNDVVRCTVDGDCRTIRPEQPLPDGILPAPPYVVAPSLVP